MHSRFNLNKLLPLALCAVRAQNGHVEGPPSKRARRAHSARGTRPLPTAIVLDIEGTVAPISFVADVLFPVRACPRVLLACCASAPLCSMRARLVCAPPLCSTRSRVFGVLHLCFPVLNTLCPLSCAFGVLHLTSRFCCLCLPFALLSSWLRPCIAWLACHSCA